MSVHEYGSHCRSINIVCARCHLGVGVFYVNHKYMGNAFRLNYIRDTTGLNSLYIMPVNKFTLSEALSRHVDLYNDAKPFPRKQNSAAT